MDVRTYKPLDGQKEFCGTLLSFDGDEIRIDENGVERTFQKADVAVVKLSVIL